MHKLIDDKVPLSLCGLGHLMDFEDNNPLSAAQNSLDTSGRISGLGPISKSLGEDSIKIVGTGKTRDNSKLSHVTYTITYGRSTVRRRYSEFESFRKLLQRLFPLIVIPPIPEKHSISSYVSNLTHAQDDTQLIDHRQRMLSVFLNRCYDIPMIRDCWLFCRFLDSSVSWNEVLTSTEVTSLPKSVLQAPPLDAAHPTPVHSYLPIPPSGVSTKAVQQVAYVEPELAAKEYELVIRNGLDRTARRLRKHYNLFAVNSVDLGGQFNALSLESQGAFANVVEKVGEAVDTEYISTIRLIENLAINFHEPLAESVQMATTARQVLRYRRHRSLQVDLTADSLAAKRQQLAVLKQIEVDSDRVNNMLHADERIASALSTSLTSTQGDDPTAKGADLMVSQVSEESGPSSSLSAKNRSKFFKIPGLSSINNAIQGFMDADPAASRRQNIEKTKLQIEHLEAALAVAKEDSEQASKAIKVEFERYQRTKEEDLKRLIRSFIQHHVEWVERNLNAWEEARDAINGMEN